MRFVITLTILLLSLETTAQVVVVDSTRGYLPRLVKHRLTGGEYFQLFVDEKNHFLTISHGGTEYRSIVYFDSTCTDANPYGCSRTDTLPEVFPQTIKLDYGASERLRLTARSLNTKQKKLIKSLFGENNDVVMAWEMNLDEDEKTDLVILRQIVEPTSSPDKNLQATDKPKTVNQLEFLLNRGKFYLIVLKEHFAEPLDDIYLSKFKCFGLPVIMYLKHEQLFSGKKGYRIYITRLHKNS